MWKYIRTNRFVAISVFLILIFHFFKSLIIMSRRAGQPLQFAWLLISISFSFAVNPPAFREILYRGVEIALAKCYTTPTEKNPKAWAAAEFRIRRKDNGEFILLYPRFNLFGLLYKIYHLMHNVKINLFSLNGIKGLLFNNGFKVVFIGKPNLLSGIIVAVKYIDK